MSVSAFAYGAMVSVPSLSVSLNTSGRTVSATPNPTISGVAYLSNGVEWGTNSDGNGSYNVSRGTWLDLGLNSEVWFERTINSGSLNNADPGAGRLAMTSNRTLAVQDTSIPGGAVTADVTITMWDAASGGNKLDEVTYTLSAERIA